jgi:5'-nucleotidase/UDP-sugar diphosphatase
MRKIQASVIAILFAALTLSVCLSGSTRTVTIFFTSDEHGYLQPQIERSKSSGGAANLMTVMRGEGYDPQSNRSILISSGDMWAGQAVSSWFEGTPAVEVANAMGYDAAAIGNHEFDWGEERLLANEKAADFPFLSANIVETASGKAPPFARPYVLKEVGGVKTAIIGLTKVDTPSMVLPSNIAGLQFTDYEKALRETAPLARSQGAELVIVAAHVCPDELRELAPVAAELSIPLLAGAHCHSMENYEQGGVRIISAGAYMKAFARVDITLHAGSGKATQTTAKLFPVEYFLNQDPIIPDAEIDKIVSGWSEKRDKELGQVIGYSESGVEKGWPLYNLLVDSWLWAYPDADIAINNFGGYRDRIPAGDIRASDIFAIWPFSNDLVELNLTGRQIMDNLDCCGGAVAGMTYAKSDKLLTVRLKSGEPLDPEAAYRVIVNSFMYGGGDGYLFSRQNPRGREIGVNFRDPAIRWILSRKTSREHPLEKLLDAAPRGPQR